MPEPNEGESREDFMHRCMADPEQRSSFPDEEQCAAVCESKWTQHEKQRPWPATAHWLKASFQGRPVGVDRQNGLVRGYVVAQEGPFKSDGRGEFDEKALRMIADMGNQAPKGLKARFTHPDLSGDGLGKYLGRSTNFTLGVARDARGKQVKAVRADLKFDPTAYDTPSGNLADYVMRLAESDPDALSSSLVLKPDEEYRLNPDGTSQLGVDGNPLPPLWRPKELHASDIVDTGDAVDGLLSAQLSADGLPLAELWQGAVLLDRVFAGQSREVVEARLTAYVGRYLDRKYGAAQVIAPVVPAATPKLDARRARMNELARRAKRE